MNWAIKQKLLTLSTLGFIFVILLTPFIFFIFNEQPSCFDGKQNGVEKGVDCGGGCEFLCEHQVKNITVDFTQYVLTGDRSDVVAQISNPNKDADAVNVQYVINLYTAGGDLLTQHHDKIAIPHGSSRAIFVPGILGGVHEKARAFLDIKNAEYQKAANESVRIKTLNFSWSRLDSQPKLKAVIRGDGVQNLRRIPVIVIVFNSDNEVMAVSQTVVDQVQSRTEKEIVFTWNEPFSAPPVRTSLVFETPF